VATVSLGAAEPVAVGAKTTLRASVAPDSALNKKLSWSSANPQVATVNGAGVVAGVSVGKARIVVKSADGGKRASAVVTVRAAADPRCAWTSAAQAVRVGVGAQRAWFCSNGLLVRVSPVTTGRSADGYDTPTGSFQVLSKASDISLYPPAGGVYPVKYWMAFSGNLYGLHDAPWQTFPYGSQQYKTAGSLGCVQVPGPVMAWLYNWAPVGAPVLITD